MNAASEAPVALVTGGARRVGATIVRALHARGWRVGVHCHRSRAEGEALVAQLNAEREGSALLLQANLLQREELERLVPALLSRWGRLDGLVNNASSFYPTPLGSVDEAAWDDLMGSNLKAPFFLSQSARESLRVSRGAIVNIVDIHAERPLRAYPVYSAAKAGLQGLTRALAQEMAPEVRVNGVAPGPIQWPEDGQIGSAEQQAIVSHTLLGREGHPQDIALAVCYLVLDAPYVTGHILAVDGGRSAHL